LGEQTQYESETYEVFVLPDNIDCVTVMSLANDSLFSMGK